MDARTLEEKLDVMLANQSAMASQIDELWRVMNAVVDWLGTEVDLATDEREPDGTPAIRDTCGS